MGPVFPPSNPIERPDLAARVSDVDVGAISTVPSTRHGGSGAIGTNLPPIFDVLQSYQDMRQPQDSAAEPAGLTHHTALILLALQLIPNLRRLHLPLLEHRFIGALPRTSARHSSPSSASLKMLAFSSFGHDYLLDQVAPIIQRAPNLEILHCHHHARISELFSATLGRGSLAEPPPLQNLTELALVNTPMTILSFRNLLSAVGPKLSKVHVRRTARQLNPLDETRILEFDEVLTALQPWRLTLKELSFTMNGIALPQTSNRLRGIHVLPEFHALEVLWVQAAFFDFYGHLGPREDALQLTLPASVRELRFFGYSQPAEALHGVVGALTTGQFVHLRSIGIDDQEFELDSEPAQELHAVGASFRSAGVAFTVHPMIIHSDPDARGS